MDLTHGFRLIDDRTIPEADTRARIYRHERTGARLLSLENDDENKAFAIAFRTRPADSTGVAHILEHSVLSGSRKYPLKDPFAELLKSSLQTFLNAFTFPDKTVYPVASQNLRDFYNLVDVYLDTVFHPLLKPITFDQEAWHLELADADGPLVRKGVVYNEMKGAYSSPDNVLEEVARQSLFPDNCYRHEYGGDPIHIPELTWDALREFHRTFYHPSNAWIAFSGDDDPEERLRILDAYLGEFDPLEIDSDIALQPPLDAPRRAVRPFAAGDADENRPQGIAVVCWVLGETVDTETNFALHALSHALVGTPASPLRKALIDSGLGEDLAGNGIEAEIRQLCFAAGLRGIRTADADAIETVVLDTLGRIADDGFDPATVEAALNTIEFVLRENNTGRFPRGLESILRSLSTWLYGGEPLALLAFEAPFNAVRDRALADPGYLPGLVRALFLDNPHRATVVLEPDPGLGAKTEANERAELDRVFAGLSDDDRATIVTRTGEIRAHAETPDPPELLARVPRLSLADMPRENVPIPCEETERLGVKVYTHPLPTRGIVYVDLGFDLHALAPEDVPYAGLFGRILLEMGTATESYVELTQRIGRVTGGIEPAVFTSEIHGEDRGACRLFLRGKAMRDRIGDLMSIFGDVLGAGRIDDRERFRRIVLEEKARLEAGLVPAGHHVVARALHARFGEAGWAADRMTGVPYLFFVRDLARDLAEDLDERWDEIHAALARIRAALATRPNLVVNLTADADGLAAAAAPVDAFLDPLPETAGARVPWPTDDDAGPLGMTLPAQVNYVGKAARLPAYVGDPHGSTQVIARYLNMTWMWERIRIQGGAYGGFCQFDPHSGVVVFASYRDPNLLNSLRVYDEAGAWLKTTPLDRDELERSIIGAIGAIDAYRLPDARGFVSLVRRLTRQTDEERQQRRDEVLATTESDFRRFADALGEIPANGTIAVLGSRAAIDTANADGDLGLRVVEIL